MEPTRDGGTTGRCSRTEPQSTVSLATVSFLSLVNGLEMVRASRPADPITC